MAFIKHSQGKINSILTPEEIEECDNDILSKYTSLNETTPRTVLPPKDEKESNE